MVCIDNLIRLYYCYHGTFDGITATNFGDQVVEQFNASRVKKLPDYLSRVLGYKSYSRLGHSTIHAKRKEFCKKSYMGDYMSSLLNEHKCNNVSELIDVLESKGILGIQKKPISRLEGYKGQGIPSKFISRDVCYALEVMEKFLDSSEIREGIKFVAIKTELIINPNVEEFFNNTGLEYFEFVNVKFADVKLPYLKDGVVYMKDTGYSEEETRKYLVKLYLLGMSTLPLYLRDKFVALLPKALSFGWLEDSLVDLLDISYVTDVTVKTLMEVFGFTLPDPEHLWREFGGFLFIGLESKVHFTNPTHDGYIDIDKDEFLELCSRGIHSLNINTLLQDRMLQNSNVFR